MNKYCKCWFDGNDKEVKHCRKRRKLAKQRAEQGLQVPMLQCLECNTAKDKKPLPFEQFRPEARGPKSKRTDTREADCSQCGRTIRKKSRSGMCLSCVMKKVAKERRYGYKNE